MMQSEQINDLATALAKAQGEIEGAKKDGTNPHFKSKYADLASVWDACREPLSKNGLAVVQTLDTDEGGNVSVISTLTHASGQWMSGKLCLKPTKPDPQGFGSAITYMRRYSLMAIVGIAPEDDDGNAASRGGPQSGGKAKTATPKTPTPKPEPATEEQEARFAELYDKLPACKTMDELQGFFKQAWPDIQKMPQDMQDKLIAIKDWRKAQLNEDGETMAA